MRAPDPAAKLAELLRRPLVKICGLTREEDVAVAAEAGADLAGFVLAESPRRAAAALPVPDSLLSVGVFVGALEDAGTDLHAALRGGERPPRPRRRPASRGRARWRASSTCRGSRKTRRTSSGRGAWTAASLLAGGLSPENVAEAIAAVRPWAVDASRSLEASLESRITTRVRAFVEAAR